MALKSISIFFGLIIESFLKYIFSKSTIFKRFFTLLESILSFSENPNPQALTKGAIEQSKRPFELLKTSLAFLKTVLNNESVITCLPEFILVINEFSL